MSTYQVVFECEGLVTLETLVRPVRRVQQEVRAQAVFERKALAALGTDVRSLARVYPQVCRQVMLHQERLAALLASVRPRLCNHQPCYLRLVRRVGGYLLLLLLLWRRTRSHSLRANVACPVGCTKIIILLDITKKNITINW